MKKLTANWGLKLASLIFAAIVWFLITNINDPVTSVRYTNIPVTLKNTNLITDQGQVYTVLDNSDVISSVTIFAPRSIIDSLTQNNIIASADIQDLSSLNTVSINVSTNKYSDKIENITPSSTVVKLSVERKASKSLALSATTSGTLADGYVIGDVSTEQNMIRISGPESIINSVKYAAVDVDVTGFTSNIGTDADIVLYDANGDPIDGSLVSMNIKTVRVNVVIYETKYVPLSFVVKGEPVTGYIPTGEVESNPSQIMIAGRGSTLVGINEIKIDDNAVDVTGYTGNLTASIDVSKYLPSGVTFGDSDYNGMAAVVVHIERAATRTLDVSIDRVQLENTVDDFKIYVDDTEYDSVSLTLEGLSDTLDGINPASLTGTVDVEQIMEDNNLTALSEGTYSAAVNWDLPAAVTVKNPVEVYVKVEKKN
ncbi:CdaR family protein [Butyrivibrio sp. DSM 10294]|uniref:CdaR family protein n=1 Tax=Butyrivibrio sp. DSM 10294 TaxID=2972457 RepID=UPI00234F5FB2|nr:CdaR family protein [Butyrivibrio sp. DSM 10294]MDC7292923.1 CdaR family protein [Butyrivibrio sp. DSM 10294]